MSSEADLETEAGKRVGQTLNGKWTIERLLGVGGMAAVYAARHRNASTAAVKVLHPSYAHDPTTRARFLREGYVANTVGHPGAVKVLDDDNSEDGGAFLVMELLEGETVQARADRKGGHLPVDQVLSIADQLLDVLSAAHDKGILHRDIKPDNIFLTTKSRLKVLDFGIARLRDSSSVSSTSTGMMMGTPAFMAPEQALGKADRLGPATDVWAVGATMFTLLTGRYVHEGESANEYLVNAATKRAPALRSLAPEIPEPIAAIIDRALSFDIADRWPDARSFQAAIRQTYQESIAATRPAWPSGPIPVDIDAPTTTGERASPVGAVPTGGAASTQLSAARTSSSAAGGSGAWFVVAGLAVAAVAGVGIVYAMQLGGPDAGRDRSPPAPVVTSSADPSPSDASAPQAAPTASISATAANPASSGATPAVVAPLPTRTSQPKPSAQAPPAGGAPPRAAGTSAPKKSPGTTPNIFDRQD